MDVAVAEMAEGADPQTPGSDGLAGPCRFVDEIGDARDRHGDIVLDRPALEALHVGDVLRATATGLGTLRLAGRDRGVLDDPILDGLAEDRLERALEIGVRPAATTVRSGRRLSCSPASGRTAPLTCFRTMSSANCGMYSNAVSIVPGAGAQALEEVERRPAARRSR